LLSPYQKRQFPLEPSTNQAPRIAQKGELGQERIIVLELRIIADGGIIGLPNAGKSTLLAAVSAARPKIAGYSFTTLEPVLGVVEMNGKSLLLAEIPGLVDGAHLGRGLGHDFLRHALRTKLLIQLIDGTSGSPVEDMGRVRDELYLFDNGLAEKPQLVVVNKIDLNEVRVRLPEIKDAFSRIGTQVYFVSAVTGEGIDDLMAETIRMLSELVRETKAGGVVEKVFRPEPRRAGVSVHREGGNYVVVAPELERIVARVDMSDPDVLSQVNGKMVRLGIGKALEHAGVKPGDKVRCGDYEWEW
ncbi:Obg family GTPase CgtA, partial [Chloroflexota bacterium]